MHFFTEAFFGEGVAVMESSNSGDEAGVIFAPLVVEATESLDSVDGEGVMLAPLARRLLTASRLKDRMSGGGDASGVE